MAHNDIEDRSVSLLVFLTDGKPTAGEVNTVKILSNTREAARGQVCIFTIGIGNDVNFKLLEKLSLENCGLTRRVQEEDDAGSQLIGSVRPSSCCSLNLSLLDMIIICYTGSCHNGLEPGRCSVT